MYEEQTDELIRNRILNNTNIDVYKGEGSFLYTSASAVAVALSEMYTALDDCVKLAIISRSSGEFLEERIKEFGDERKEGTAAKGTVKFTGLSGSKILDGTIIKNNGLTFRVIADGELNSDGILEILVEAVENGESGNVNVNTKFELDAFDSNILSIEAVENFTGGYDKESDEDVKERFFYFRKHQTTSGNEFHLKKWALEVEGVERAEVYENWAGKGTVKVVVFGADNTTLPADIVKEVEENIEENRTLCADITVTSASKIAININATVKTKNADIENLSEEFRENLNSYFLTSRNEINYIKILSCLATCKDVIDLEEFTVNGNKENINITQDQVPIVETIVLTESEN